MSTPLGSSCGNRLVLIFVIGGICYSEINAIAEVSNKIGGNFNFVIGTTRILNPDEFMFDYLTRT